MKHLGWPQLGCPAPIPRLALKVFSSKSIQYLIQPTKCEADQISKINEYFLIMYHNLLTFI